MNDFASKAAKAVVLRMEVVKWFHISPPKHPWCCCKEVVEHPAFHKGSTTGLK